MRFVNAALDAKIVRAVLLFFPGDPRGHIHAWNLSSWAAWQLAVSYTEGRPVMIELRGRMLRFRALPAHHAGRCRWHGYIGPFINRIRHMPKFRWTGRRRTTNIAHQPK